MNTVRAMDTELLELQNLTDPDRPITYGVVKPGPEDSSTGIVFIRGGDISNGLIDEENLRTITQEVSRPYARTILRGGEVVISLVGNPGEVAVVPDRLAGANLARQAGLIALRPEIDAAYIKYYLMSPPGKAELFQRTQGAVQQVINLSDLKRVKVRLPSRQVQEGIVSILSAYDDLIENNQRRIALLEETARLLYREWFVHLRFPGHQDVKITDGLPEGWESRKLGDLLAKIKRPGKVKKGDYLQEGSIPCVDQSESFIGGYTNNEDAQITTPLPLIVFGDHTRVVKFIDFPFACGADGTQLLFPKDARLSIQYFYYAVSNVDLSNYFYARHLKFLKDQNLLLPTANLISEFTDFSKDTLKQVSVLREASHYLARARDLLLPRLMNGEIAV